MFLAPIRLPTCQDVFKHPAAAADMAKFGVVEFHAFRDNYGQYIVKELALVSGADKCYTQIFFKPPFAKTELETHYRRMADWLETNLHRIPWEFGDTEFTEETMRTLCGYFDTIYTKGAEKVRYLQQFHNDVKQLPDTAPKTKFGQQVECPVHILSGPCALHSAVALMDWLLLQRDYVRESVRLESFSDCPDVSPNDYERLAKEGFYFDPCRKRVVCVWCNDFYDWHTSCVRYYKNNIPVEFEVVIPRM